jgi:exonuclease SbcC
LERLTDGDMSLYFETLREGKSKKTGPIETLDIKVSDNLGTRPLEMYSGGEGFRAAFALRIALSKLLARRAGARLQTLIIDEGFGTQDGKGREKLVEALNAIQEDFEKIIVITHIDELKDAFASRIEITKTPAGSQFTIMEGAAG